MVPTDEEIEKIVTALRDTFKVAYVAPGHCTGEPTFTALKESFADRYLYAGLGTTFAVGTTPRPIASARQGVTTVMNEEDLGSYRALLATSDDTEHTLLAHAAH